MKFGAVDKSFVVAGVFSSPQELTSEQRRCDLSSFADPPISGELLGQFCEWRFGGNKSVSQHLPIPLPHSL